MRYFFRYLFRPSFWLSNYSVNKEWDYTLNELIDNAKNIKIQRNTMEIDGVGIWIANFPYAYGNPYKFMGPEFNFLPRRITRERLNKFVIDNQLKQMKEKGNHDSNQM